MELSRRAVLAGMSSGLIAATHWPADTAPSAAVNEVVALSGFANASLMRGDIESYRKLISLSDDFTFFSPFGGKPTHRVDFTDDKIIAMWRFFSNGTFKQTVVGAYSSGDLVVLALIEQQNVEVGGLPAQEWPLRVTLVYRRIGSKWQLAHRHADPLLSGISLAEAASLARRIG